MVLRKINLPAMLLLFISIFPAKSYSLQEYVAINIVTPDESWLITIKSPFKNIEKKTHYADTKDNDYYASSEKARQRYNRSCIYSPDSKSVANIVRDSRNNSIKLNYTYVGTIETTKEYKPNDGNYIWDVTWSSDSKYLLIIERNSSVKKTPGSLFRYLFGHGDIVSSFSLTTIDVDSGIIYHQRLGSDLQSGVAMFVICVDCK